MNNFQAICLTGQGLKSLLFSVFFQSPFVLPYVCVHVHACVGQVCVSLNCSPLSQGLSINLELPIR